MSAGKPQSSSPRPDADPPLEGEPLRDSLLQPIQKSLTRVLFWHSLEFNIGMGCLWFLCWVWVWPDLRLTVCQLVVLGSSLMMLWGNTQWFQLYSGIDWKGPIGAIDETLRRMRDVRWRQFRWVALLALPFLTTLALVITQAISTSPDEEFQSLFTQLDHWLPTWLLPGLLAGGLGGIWSILRRWSPEDLARRSLGQSLLDGGSVALCETARQVLEPREGQPLPAVDSGPPVATSVGESVLTPPSSYEFDSQQLRESALRPIRHNFSQVKIWPAMEIVGSVALLGCCVVFLGHWPDPRLDLCLGVGIAASVALIVINALWLRRAAQLDWDAPLEALRASLVRLRQSRIDHFWRTTLGLMFVAGFLIFPVMQFSSDNLLGSMALDWESVLDNLNPGPHLGTWLVVLIQTWFVTIPLRQPAMQLHPRSQRLFDGGAMAAFDRAWPDLARAASSSRGQVQ